ncbi:superoxide dismutase [Cu-Zn] [Patiriisocius marinistellae]|uniref:Superoxide dismutase [Cu-Zn] n=1 Tax=Patiriisocius marinistellae TaxID=2494560 RepID=A0A5J4FX75_9FLAO|nr:superoxide dismutase family protein [Patiriisocius marinistellae]GEQ85918.1 superoxide dismutase [Cu-Zn] [Patiriisocius marinistellae]
MKKLALATLSILAITFTSCKNEAKKTETETESTVTEMKNENEKTLSETSKSVAFMLESKSGGNATGKVNFKQDGDMVMFEASLSGLKPGMHAIHIHENADCSSEDGKSAGGHWNPTMKNHGKWGDEAGYHKGDIGNFKVEDDGTGSISMQTNEWCIGCGDNTKDILGKSIIVHQGIDDFKSQPSGDAGARMSCGGIIQ